MSSSEGFGEDTTLVPVPVTVPPVPSRGPVRRSHREKLRSKQVNAGGMMSSRVSSEAAARFQLRPDSIVREEASNGLVIWRCPGLTVIGVANNEAFQAARLELTSRLLSPRDKAAIVFPRTVRFQVNPAVLRELADVGIVIVQSKLADAEQAAMDYARTYSQRLTDSATTLADFMKR